MVLMEPKTYFSEAFKEALSTQSLSLNPMAENYIVDLLEHYIVADHLFDSEGDGTLATLFLKANGIETNERQRYEMLKKLGDSALYVSGFFGDSLQKKMVDVGYYINMGVTAYHSLSNSVNDQTFSNLYDEIANQFNGVVDALTLMSQKCMISQGDDNVLRLMDLYRETGSKTAKRSLANIGIFANPELLKKCNNQ